MNHHSDRLPTHSFGTHVWYATIAFRRFVASSTLTPSYKEIVPSKPHLNRYFMRLSPMRHRTERSVAKEAVCCVLQYRKVREYNRASHRGQRLSNKAVTGELLHSQYRQCCRQLQSSQPKLSPPNFCISLSPYCCFHRLLSFRGLLARLALVLAVQLAAPAASAMHLLPLAVRLATV